MVFYFSAKVKKSQVNILFFRKSKKITSEIVSLYLCNNIQYNVGPQQGLQRQPDVVLADVEPDSGG